MTTTDPEKLDIIFTAPHPDDIEIGCGGTIAKMVSQGYRVGMVHMTNGEPTPLGDPATRLAEMRAAAAVLGAQVCEMIDLPNRVLMDGPESRYALATVIRRYKPRILVGIAGRTVAASPDHYQAQLITEAARFHAQLTKWDARFGGTQPHRVDHLLYRPVARSLGALEFPAQIVVDISETLERKLAAVACYATQFPRERLERMHAHLRSLATYEGASCGYDFGELFVVPRPIGAADLMELFDPWPIASPVDLPKLQM